MTQLEQCLVACRELLKDYQRRHEAAEWAWARAFSRLQGQVHELDARVRAYDAWQLPGATELAKFSKQISDTQIPNTLDSQVFDENLNEILEKVGQ